MHKRTLGPPVELVQLQERFAEWRQSPNRGKRIPKPLWLAAAKVAVEFGIHRTTRCLRLDYYSLKKHVDALQGSSTNGQLQTTEPSAFIELPAPAAMLSECTIELQDGRGSSMRIHLKGTGYPDIVGLGRSFWSAE